MYFFNLIGGSGLTMTKKVTGVSQIATTAPLSASTFTPTTTTVVHIQYYTIHYTSVAICIFGMICFVAGVILFYVR